MTSMKRLQKPRELAQARLDAVRVRMAKFVSDPQLPFMPPGGAA